MARDCWCGADCQPREAGHRTMLRRMPGTADCSEPPTSAARRSQGPIATLALPRPVLRMIASDTAGHCPSRRCVAMSWPSRKACSRNRTHRCAAAAHHHVNYRSIADGEDAGQAGHIIPFIFTRFRRRSWPSSGEVGAARRRHNNRRGGQRGVLRGSYLLRYDALGGIERNARNSKSILSAA